jgi:3',5'-cyclic AMP phosphodiesterase CpdA
MIIVQVSDPHLTDGPAPRRGYDGKLALAATLARVRALDPRPDLVIFTGDIAENGTAGEYARFRALAAGLELPMAAIPGNHDRRGPFLAGLADSGIAVGAGPFLQFALDDWPVRVLGLDTLEEGSNAGRLCTERLAWVAARLAEDPRPAILFMHHPPFRNGIAFSDASACANADGLAALVAAHGRVVRVACGHVHRAVDTAWAGTVAGSCPSVAWQVPLDLSPGGPPRLVRQRPGYQLHLWTPATGLVTHTEYLNDG